MGNILSFFTPAESNPSNPDSDNREVTIENTSDDTTTNITLFVPTSTFSIPSDKDSRNSRQIRSAFYTLIMPDIPQNPILLGLSKSGFEAINLDPTDPNILSFFSGQKLPPRALPWASIYAGHQVRA